MAEIAGTEAVIAVIGRWAPIDLAYIEKLEYLAASEDAASAVSIVALFQRRDGPGAWPSSDRGYCRVCLVFTGPANLSLKEFGRATQITGFYIEDISARQWEGLRFSVGDHENGRIEFLCREVRVLSASALPPVSPPAVPRELIWRLQS
jgi:hypothetical protein